MLAANGDDGNGSSDGDGSEDDATAAGVINNLIPVGFYSIFK